jgi:hypothetical protein
LSQRFPGLVVPQFKLSDRNRLRGKSKRQEGSEDRDTHVIVLSGIDAGDKTPNREFVLVPG